MKLKIFIFLVIIASVTFFTKDRYRNIVDIDQRVLAEPVQIEAFNKEPVKFTKAGFSYEVSPLYEYDISGLVVSAQKYNTWYSLSRVDRVFPTDLCVIWGENVKSGAYRARGTKFDQDFRFCLYSYNYKNLIVNEAVSNNHLVIKDEDVERLARSVEAGDQIRINGKLVNVEAKPIGSAHKYEPEDLRWNSSVSRTDTGGGACETILVERLEILKRGNSVSDYIFKISLLGIGLIIFWEIYGFLKAVLGNPLSPRF